MVDGDQGLGHIEAVVRAVVAPLWHLGQVFKGGDEVVGEAARHEEGLLPCWALQLPLQGAQHVQHAAALEAAVFVKLPIGRREVEVQLVRHPGLGDDGGQALLQQAQQGGAVVAEGRTCTARPRHSMRRQASTSSRLWVPALESISTDSSSRLLGLSWQSRV